MAPLASEVRFAPAVPASVLELQSFPELHNKIDNLAVCQRSLEFFND